MATGHSKYAARQEIIEPIDPHLVKDTSGKLEWTTCSRCGIHYFINSGYIDTKTGLPYDSLCAAKFMN